MFSIKNINQIQLNEFIIGKIIAIITFFIFMLFILLFNINNTTQIDSSVINKNNNQLNIKEISFINKKIENSKEILVYENINNKNNIKFIEINSKIEKPKNYEDKNEDMLNLYKVNNFIIENKSMNLDFFDSNDIIKEIKDKNSYIALKHIINIENMFLLDINYKEIKNNAIQLNNEITNLIINVNKNKSIEQIKKEKLFNNLYDDFDNRFNYKQKKLLEKYKNEDEDDDIIFIQNNINEIKFLK